ncbi:MAG: 3-hydroxyacyl-ACP dehydratase FabZ family protein [Verrucomicrobiota bacterium]|jgi:3-hydroxyacyl-[acyl-carrier-protein] dehydratase
MSAPVDLAAALQLLPHGPEFRFVDRLLSLTPGREGVGEYRVRGDEPFLRGHFPGEPLMPGVLLVEAAAQLAGIVAQTDPEIGPLDGLKLTAIRAAKITGSAQPGDTIQLTARITGRLGPLIQAEGEVTLNGRVLLTATLVLGGVSAGLRAAIWSRVAP